MFYVPPFYKLIAGKNMYVLLYGSYSVTEINLIYFIVIFPPAVDRFIPWCASFFQCIKKILDRTDGKWRLIIYLSSVTKCIDSFIKHSLLVFYVNLRKGEDPIVNLLPVSPLLPPTTLSSFCMGILRVKIVFSVWYIFQYT